VEAKVDFRKVSPAEVSIVTSHPPSFEQEETASDQDIEEINL
jgi:hypothetical protein